MGRVLLLLGFVLGFGFTPLEAQSNPFEAARLGDSLWMHKWLRKHPGKVDTLNAEGHAPIMLAAYHGHEEMVMFLLRRGANLNFLSPEGSLVAALAFIGDTLLLKKLLVLGADPNLTAADGITPLMYAAMSGNLPALELLLQFGANPIAEDAEGHSAWFYARKAGHDACGGRLEVAIDAVK